MKKAIISLAIIGLFLSVTIATARQLGVITVDTVGANSSETWITANNHANNGDGAALVRMQEQGKIIIMSVGQQVVIVKKSSYLTRVQQIGSREIWYMWHENVATR